MIKPLNGVSNVAFKSSLEDYQAQIRDKKEPKYQLVVSPSSEAAKTPGFKQSVAGVFKGFNNVSGIATGVAKGIGKGILFGGLAGVVAKNYKQASQVVLNEAGKKVRSTNLKGFIKGVCGDLGNFAGKIFKSIPNIFSKSPLENLKSLKDLPKRYFEYLGKGKAVKAIAIGVAAITLGYNIVKSKIQANRKNADIDHSWNLKH